MGGGGAEIVQGAVGRERLTMQISCYLYIWVVVGRAIMQILPIYM